MDIVDIIRHKNTPQSLMVGDKVDLKKMFININTKQDQFKQSLTKILESIFKSYKRNNFENNKQLNLTSTYFLLKALSNESGEFIDIITNKYNEFLQQIKDFVADIEIPSEYDNSIKKKNIESDILTIFETVIKEYKKNDKQDKNKDYQLNNRWKINTIQLISSNIFSNTLKELKKFQNSSVKHIENYSNRYLKSKYIFNTSISNQSIKTIIDITDKRIKTRLNNVKDINGFLRGVFVSINKIKGSLTKLKNKIFKTIRKDISDITKNISVGGILRGIGGGLLSLGMGVVGMGFSVLKFIFYTAPKFILSSVWKLGKFLALGVKTAVLSIHKFLVKPILPMVIGFFMTSPGAFLLGMISAYISKQIIKIKDNFGFENIKNTITGWYKGLSESTSEFYGFLSDKLNNFNKEKFLDTLKDITNLNFLKGISKIFEFISPDDLVIGAVNVAIGAMVGKVTMSAVTAVFKGAAFASLGPALLGVGLPLLGAVMIWEWYKYDKKKKKEEKDKSLGMQYKNSLDIYNKLKHESQRNRKFAIKNRQIYTKQSKSINMSGDEKIDNNIVNLVGGVVEYVNEEQKLIEERNKIKEFCREEANKLKDEQEKLTEDAARDPDNQRDRDKYHEMAFDVMYTVNGETVTSNILPSFLNKNQTIELRTKNLLYRSKLLNELKNTNINGWKQDLANDLIAQYNNATENLININGSSTSDTEASFTADVDLFKMRFAKTGEKNAWNYAVNDWIVTKGGKIDWNNMSSDDVQRVIHATLAVHTAKENGYKLTINKNTGDVEEAEAEGLNINNENVRITGRHFKELREIFIDMCCGITTNIPAKPYITPRSDIEIFDLFMMSNVVVDKIQEILNNNKDKFNNYFNVDIYRPRDPKMLSFLKSVLQTTGKSILQEIIEMIEQKMTNMFNANARYRFIALNNNPSEGSIFAVFTDTKDQYELYRYNTMEINQLKNSDYNKIRQFIETKDINGMIVYKTISGNKYGQIAEILDYNDYIGGGEDLKQAKLRISYLKCRVDMTYKNALMKNLGVSFIEKIWDLLVFYLQNAKEMTDEQLIDDYIQQADEYHDNSKLVSGARQVMDALESMANIVKDNSGLFGSIEKTEQQKKEEDEARRNIEETINNENKLDKSIEEKQAELRRLEEYQQQTSNKSDTQNMNIVVIDDELQEKINAATVNNRDAGNNR